MEQTFGILYFLLTVINFKTPEISGATSISISKQVNVSATVGEPRLSIYGFAPANSTVYLNGVGIFQQTTAFENGYFIFENIYIPYAESAGYSPDQYYPELCLYAVDTKRIPSSPVCIPPLSSSVLPQIAKNQNKYPSYIFEVGPVLIAPTISLSQGSFVHSSQAKAQGMTTPESKVSVYLARDKGSKHLLTSLNPIKPLLAYHLPKYEVVSDKNGYYEFNLPNSQSDNWKVFTSVYTNGGNSPKSNTLKFKVESAIIVQIKKAAGFLESLKPYLIYLVIIIQLLIVLTILVALVNFKKEDKKHHKPAKEVKTPGKVPVKHLNTDEEFKKAQSEYLELLRKRGRI